MFRFLGKLLVFVFTCLVLAIVGATAVVILWGDRLLLDLIRKESGRLAPTKIYVGDLHTKLLNPFDINLTNVEIEHEGTKIKIGQAKLSSPLGGLTLLSNYQAKREIPLALTLSRLDVTLPKMETVPAQKKDTTPQWPSSIPLPLGLPLPAQLDLTITSADIHGPYEAKDISAKGNFQGYPAGVEGSGTVRLLAGVAGGTAFVPLSIEFKASGTPRSVQVQKFVLRAAGIEGSASGKLDLQPVQGDFKAKILTPDLSTLMLRPEDRAALGLHDQPSGGIHFELDATADSRGNVTGKGTMRLLNLVLPIQAPENTMWSGVAEGSSFAGKASLQAELPFRASLAWPSLSPKFMVEKFSALADLTNLAITSPGKIKKPAGVPLRAEIEGAGGANGLYIESFRLTFHSLSASGNANIPYPLGQSVLAGFQLKVASLAGFPEYLPMLQETQEKGATIADAVGSVQADGQVRFLAGKPASSMVNIKNFEVRGLKLPLAFSHPQISAKGLLVGSASMQGKYDAGDLSVAHSSGSFDLTNLQLSLKDKLNKKRGRKLVFAFDAKGTTDRLQVNRISLEAEGLSATLNGTAAFNAKRAAQLNLRSTARAELGPLREYLPALPMKISSGSLDAQLSLGGTWIPEGGLEKSPLALAGKITGKLGTVEMPEAPSEKKNAEPPKALLPPWPVARNANVEYRVDLAEFKRGALTASKIAAQGALRQGKFTAQATVGQTFGGKVTLRNLSGSLLESALPVQGIATADGLDLSQMAGFVDKSYASIVKGKLKANSSFQVPDVWSESILASATAKGDAQISNGYLSTATFDGLVNEKLKSIPGLGSNANVSTGGVAAAIRTDFQFANSTAEVKNFVAATPKNDEMRLAGKLGLNFDADLTGEAHLASAPVAGSVRAANSDPQGRLVVPVRFHGNLKSPQVDIAAHTIEAMLKNTATHEGNKLKDKAVSDVQKKAEEALKDAAGGLLKGLGK